MATWPAATASRTDVLAAIALSSPGDTVTVPANTGISWAGDISITGIHLIGAGLSASTGTVITAGKVTVNKHASQYAELKGFRFTGSDQHLIFTGASTDKAFIVDYNYFQMDGGSEQIHGAVNGGLFHHNTFESTLALGNAADVFNIQTAEDWSTAPTFGTDDTTGERNIYFEDNICINVLETCPDSDIGTRLVVRHNDYYDSSIVLHSGTPNDSSPNGGHRHCEVYSNNFHRVSNSMALNKWIWARGGSGVWANNVMDKAESPDGSTYPGKPCLKLSVGCPTAYPIQYQIGQTSSTPDATPDKPWLIFGNTGAGNETYAHFIALDENVTVACAVPSNYIQSGRDYVTSNTWGWVAYQYPHPLQGSIPVTGNGGFIFRK